MSQLMDQSARAVELEHARQAVAVLSVALEQAVCVLSNSSSEEVKNKARLLLDATQKVSRMELAQFDQQVDGSIAEVRGSGRDGALV